MAIWQIEFSKQAYKSYKMLQKRYLKKDRQNFKSSNDQREDRYKASRRRKRYL